MPKDLPPIADFPALLTAGPESTPTPTPTPQAAPALNPPDPIAGGCYERDPITGALTLVSQTLPPADINAPKE
jgi:hypothetical protein